MNLSEKNEAPYPDVTAHRMNMLGPAELDDLLGKEQTTVVATSELPGEAPKRYVKAWDEIEKSMRSGKVSALGLR